MTTPSNIYAEKVFAEHPISLWALDDKNDYVSYIAEAERDLSSSAYWNLPTATTIKNKDAISELEYNDIKDNFVFSDSAITQITTPTGYSSITFTTKTSVVTSTKYPTFAVGLYVYSASPISSIVVGVTELTGQDKTFSDLLQEKQNHISSTFIATGADSDSPQAITLSITINYSTPGQLIYINGLTVGSLSEEFSGSSLGVDLLPMAPLIPEYERFSFGFADAYGSDINHGFYLAQDGVLLARNTSIPMVYGAQSTTVLRPGLAVQQEGVYTTSVPGVLLPAYGMFNELGNSSTRTLEAWIRVSAADNANVRLIGSITSDDGLYIDGPHLILKIGTKICSYFIDDWFKPMIIHITTTRTRASLMVDGEIVGRLSLEESDLVNSYQTYEDDLYDNDWIAISAGSETSNIFFVEIDCVAIYGYEVTPALAKRRFVYGQGVEYPKNVVSLYSGEMVYPDASFANYSKTYNFPQISNWNTGRYDNLLLQSNAIYSPKYSLPELRTSDSSLTLQKLADDLLVLDSGIIVSPEQFTLKPTGLTAWASANTFLYFNNLNVIEENRVKVISGTFKQLVAGTTEQVLFKLYDSANDAEYGVYLTGESGTTIEHRYFTRSLGANTISSKTETISIGTWFDVSIDLDYVASLNAELSSLVNNKTATAIYVMGDYSGPTQELSTTFTGIVKNIGFSTEKNLSYLTNFLVSPRGKSYEIIRSQVGLYSFFDIKTNSYWESQIPLSVLSTTTKDSSNQDVQSIDYVKIDIEYPQSISASDGITNFANRHIRTYVTFQSIESGAIKPFYEFSSGSPEQIGDSLLVVKPGTGWEDIRYPVVDGSIIYMPNITDGTSLSTLAICLHFEITAFSSNTKQLFIKSCSVSSKNLSNNSSLVTLPINGTDTKFNKPIYPYKEAESGSFSSNISYSQKVPFTITKDSSPHLYLSSTSGISLAGEYTQTSDEGLFFKINESLSENSKVGSLQMALMWNKGYFPTSEKKIFEISSTGATYRFYIKSLYPTQSTRGYLFAKKYSNGSETVAKDIKFYLNGLRVMNPIISYGEWGMVGIQLSTFLSFANSLGFFKITYPVHIDNITTYQLDPSVQAQQLSYNLWNSVDDGTWSDYDSDTWNAMQYQTIEVNASINPEDIYKFFIGTNKYIADSGYKSGVLRLKNYQYASFDNIQWNSYIVNRT